MSAKTLSSVTSRNTIAEIKGSTYPEQVRDQPFNNLAEEDFKNEYSGQVRTEKVLKMNDRTKFNISCHYELAIIHRRLYVDLYMIILVKLGC